MASNSPVIKLIKTTAEDVLVWNKDDIQELRTKWRIVGRLIGSNPAASRQNQILSVPLYMTKDEVTLLLEKEFAQLYEETNPDIYLTEEVKANRLRDLNKFYSDSFQEQRKASCESKKAEILSRADEIVKGKMKHVTENSKKTADQMKQEILHQALSSITPPADDAMLVQQFTECVWRRPLRHCQWGYPSSNEEFRRYTVYKDLWSQGNFVTYGAKFGGDFLVYPGDPELYHAKYIAVVRSTNDNITATDVSQMARLASNVKKSLLICSVDDNNDVLYREIKYGRL